MNNVLFEGPIFKKYFLRKQFSNGIFLKKYKDD